MCNYCYLYLTKDISWYQDRDRRYLMKCSKHDKVEEIALGL
jgi:hypothetical protein